MMQKALSGRQLHNGCLSRPSSHPPAAVASRPASRQHSHTAFASAGGFGKSNKKKVTYEGGMVVPKEGKRVRSSDLTDDASPAGRSKASDGAPAGFPTDWVDLKFKASDMPIGKNTKPIELATGRTLMLYKFEGMVYVSDANSTAYQYPMVDAKVFRDSSGAVAAEVPLDGTVYDLATGAVLKWCPKDNLVRNVLGSLKEKVQQSPLKVYPVHVTKDGAIWTKLV